MYNIDYIKDLYITLKRMVHKNPFIRLPKHQEKFNKQMQEVVDIINKYHIEPNDFLTFMAKYYSPMRIFPQPCHLKSEKAINIYRRHQVRKNIYWYDDYSINGDQFFIHETLETVSLSKDIRASLDKDLRLKWALHLATYPVGNLLYKPKSKEDIIYAIIKLQFLGKPIPSQLMTAKEKTKN